MRVRDATSADAEAVRAVHRESVLELGRAVYSEMQVEAWASGVESADYAAAIESEDLAYLVAEHEEESAGERDTDVTDGVGSRVYEELERRARDHGYERVRERDHEFASHEDTDVTGTVVEMVKEL